MTAGILLNTAGREILFGGRGLLVGGAVGQSPNTIAGLASWWDAGVAPSGGWSAVIGGVPDKLGATTLTASASGEARARLVGTLGGVGQETSQTGGYPATAWMPTLLPLMDPNWSLSATLAFGTGGAATFELVVSRPNVRQAFVSPSGGGRYLAQSLIGGMSALITIGGVVVIGVTGTGGGDSVVAFPNGTPVTLLSNVPQRFTASLRLCGSHAAGWDVYWNGVKLNSGAIASQLGVAPTTTAVQFCGVGTNSAQVWFHEALFWPRALNSSEVAVAEAYIGGRWQRRARTGAILFMVSQSNGINTWLATNAFRALCTGIQYMTGMLSVSILTQQVGSNSADYSVLGGHGLIGDNSNYLVGAIPGTDPSLFPLGTGGPGIGTQNFVRLMPSWMQPDVCGLFGMYSENDSAYQWPNRAAFAAALKRYVTLFRAFPQYGPALDQTNSAVFWNNSLGVFNSGSAHRAAVELLVVDPTVQAVFWANNTVDGNQSGSTYNAATGVFTGGDSAHFDGGDDLTHTYLGVAPMARKLIAIGRADAGTVAMPASIPLNGGPTIASAHYEAGTVSGNAATPTVLVTIAHDGGTDLAVPLLAVNGLGWALLDGGIPDSSPAIYATACVRVSPTTLRVTFPAVPVSALASCSLWYVFGFANTSTNSNDRLGRGNAVTDNYGLVSATLHYDIAADLGAAYRVNRAVQASYAGMAFT